MKITNLRARHFRCWQPAKRSTAWMAMAVAIAMSTGISSAADPIGISCALPYLHGHSDPGCVGQHTVVITTSHTDTNAKVTAELLALDVNGNLIKSFTVKNGDNLQLGSRLKETKFNQNSNLLEVFAPVPLLHVTVENQGQKAEAYCSNIPYVQVVQPTGGVVSESSGEKTKVVAAVPLTNPSSIHLFIDGVDLLPLVPNVFACKPSTPCSGVANINGKVVGYSDLVIDIAPNIETPASNTIRVALSDLACGGHVFRVSSSKLPDFPDKVANTCNVDSLSKIGTSSIFAISIADPTPGKVTALVPTPVLGEVCSGTQITAVGVNGKNLPVVPQPFTPGNGTTTGPVYKVAINTTLDQTDLVRDAFGDHAAPLGTFDRGTNRLAAAAKEIKGTRTYKNVIFATGNVAPVAIDPNATVFNNAAIQTAFNENLQKLVETNIQGAMNSVANTDLNNAFVVGLSAGGAQTMFNKLCTSPVVSADASINGLTPGQIFKKKVKEAIQSVPLNSFSLSSPCSCDPTINLTLNTVDVGDTVSCNLTFSAGKFHVTMGLPDVHVAIDAKGECHTGGDICVEGVAVGVQGTADITGIKFDFDVTEANLLGNTTSTPVFFKGSTATGAHDISNAYGGTGVSNCGLSFVCTFLVEVFTLGQIDLTPTINISQVNDFSGQIGASEPDPVKLKQIKVDPAVVASFNQKSAGDVSEVHITSSGITAGLVGHFATLAVDASVPATPGVTLTPAPVPSLPVPNAKDIFIGISDDAINMMFASLTAAGKLQTGTPGGNGCIDTGATVGSLLPANCDTLTLDSDLTTVAARGYCHAIKGSVCSSIVYNNPALSATDNANLTATMRGECFGAQGLPAGQTCDSIAQGNLLTWAACNITPNFNLHAPQPLLFCTKGDVPPRMLFPDDPGNGASVPAVLRIPSLSVSLIIDRDLSHQTAGAFANVPGCFAQGTSTAVDCNVFSACLTLNLNFSMAFQTCVQDGKPGFKPTFQNIQVLAREVGTVCGGATSPTSDADVLAAGSNQQITIPLGQNGAGFAPPICGVGLDLGGFVSCTQPGVLSIRSENVFPDSRDYLAITCKIQ